MRQPTQTQLENAFRGRRVLVTGHTGFKGSWLTLWLLSLGADVSGYGLAPNTQPSIFQILGLETECGHTIADVRDLDMLSLSLARVAPDFIFHLAAQALVRSSYEKPLETIEINVGGTANLLEAVRRTGRPCTVVIVTSDKCYENRESDYAYREGDSLGGRDIYSMSKGAAELVAAAYRDSFFSPSCTARHGVRIATARSGNVMGGGDWASDRIVPDCVRALSQSKPVLIRRPESVRPWQHVLEPLAGYLLLAARMAGDPPLDVPALCGPWNFGPRDDRPRTVLELVSALIASWGAGTWERDQSEDLPDEAGLLRLSIEKAASRLSWAPRWTFEQGVDRTIEWYGKYYRGSTPTEMRQMSLNQISAYMNEQSL